MSASEQTKANIRNYYLSYNISLVGTGLVGVFINVFFLATIGYIAVLYFQIATWTITLVAYILSGYLMRKYHPKYLYSAGLILGIILLAVLLTVQSALSNVMVFGLIYGTSIGILYAGNNVVMYDITKGTNRTSFVAVNNLLGGIASLIAPVAAGVLIEFSPLPGVYKFLLDFVIASVFFVIAIFYIMKIKHRGKFRLSYSIRGTFIRAGKDYSKFNWYFIVSTIFGVGYSVIVPLYVFQTTGSYLITGIFAGFEVLVYTLTNFAFRKGFAEGRAFATYAVPALILSSLVLLIPKIIPPPINAFIFSGLATFFTTPLDNAVSVKYMKFLDRNKRINRALFWANREYYLVIGRIAILAPMILVACLVSTSTVFIALIPLLAFYSLIYYTIIKRGPIRLLGFAEAQPRDRTTE
jgi:MFS family permease